MTDIELFFKTVESEIRSKYINFLKSEKALPNVDPPPEDNITAKELEYYEKKGRFKLIFWFVERFLYIKRVRLIKRFNNGIDTALKVLQREYKDFVKRMETEKPRGSKF